MLYSLFIIIAILYNVQKFYKERVVFLDSLINATSSEHREMILSHHFHIFIFEAFLGLIVSDLISQGQFDMGLLGYGCVYVLLVFFGFFLYQYFLKYLERKTNLPLRETFNPHLIKEFRVSFGLIILPIIMYSLLSWTFQSEAGNEVDSFLLVEFLTNIIFVSVLTISCTVIIMLRLLPNRDITEPIYLDMINKRLAQIGMPNMRVKWIETDIKNAFVVGLKILRFSNQTMFIGRSLRTTLTLEEFDAVIAHELAHVANRHIHKRVIELLKNLVSAVIGFSFLLLITLSFFYLYLGEDLHLYEKHVAVACAVTCISWLFFNYSLFFDTIRSHEYEADAYAVMEMGASLEGLKSALLKLTQPVEIPEYLKSKIPKSKKKNFVSKIFSTHPEVTARFSSLEYKIAHGLPFNYYVSAPQKIRSSFSFFLQWKVSAPLMLAFVFTTAWGTITVRQGAKLVSFVHEKDPEAIKNNRDVSQNINNKPFLVGKSLMYHVVQKQNPELIDYYLAKGASPGRTLIYLSETKNFDLFKAYYPNLAHRISEDEYYLILLKSAEMNFTEGYRYLVNTSRFDTLNPEFKHELVRNMRRPASVDKE